MIVGIFEGDIPVAIYCIFVHRGVLLEAHVLDSSGIQY